MIELRDTFTKGDLYGATHHRWRGPPPYFIKDETGMIGLRDIFTF